MSTYQEHRIYKRLNEPFRILGLTMDEAFMGVLGFVFFMNVRALLLKVFFAVFFFGGIFVMRKAKKEMKGFNMRSTLMWMGLRKPPSHIYPSPLRRFYLP